MDTITDPLQSPVVDDVAALDALPVGSVVMCSDGRAAQKGRKGDWLIVGRLFGEEASDLLDEFGPVRLLEVCRDVADGS